MTNTVMLAVAGARKTQSIVDACTSGNPSARRLIITYTLSAQRDLEQRLKVACTPENVPRVCGWYAFLMRYWIRPFLPLLYPGRRLKGLNFDGSPAMNKRGVVIAKGEDRYLDNNSRAYKRFLSKLAIDVAEVSGGAVTDRLQRMFDEIYIDEVQDLTGYDLDVLELLLKTKSNITMVGDLRQSVFNTNPQDPRNKKYQGLGKHNWFKEQESKKHLQLNYSSCTWRCVNEIAAFSDTLFGSELQFPKTTSAQTATSEHQGVFALTPADVPTYVERYRPVCLRQTVRTSVPAGISATNFGVSKGLTHNRVLIFPTTPIIDFLTKGVPLKDATACGLYVGITRAVYSVAFVLPDPNKSALKTWSPQS